MKPATSAAFDDYIRQHEQKLGNELVLERFPAIKEEAKRGNLVTKPYTDIDPKAEPKAPGGQIQHWYGAMFLPGATVKQAKSVLSDYDHYPALYAPDVTDARLLARKGDDYDVYLKLHKMAVISVKLDTKYHIQYRSPEPNRLLVRSASTDVKEVDNPLGMDNGFLWRLNSYWRFHQVPEGLWAECEAISLSRSTPLGLQVMIGGLIKKFPRESMENTLTGTQRAIRSRVP